MEHQPINRLKDRSGCELGKTHLLLPSKYNDKPPLRSRHFRMPSLSTIPSDRRRKRSQHQKSLLGRLLFCVVLCRFVSFPLRGLESCPSLCAHLLNTYTQILTLHIKTSQNTDVKEKRMMFPSALASFAAIRMPNLSWKEEERSGEERRGE